MSLSSFACTRTVDIGNNNGAADAGVPDSVGGGNNDATPGQDASAAGDARDGATGPRYVFLTRGVYNGNMGGLMGADQRCQSSAEAARLEGKYVAWLSDSNTDAKDRIRGNGPWLEPKTEKVLFPNRAALLGFPEAALVRDEYGDPAKDRWWTGTSASGVRNTQTCVDWTSTSQFQGGMTGNRKGTTRPGIEWTEDSAFSCVVSDLQKYALICLGE